jgi:hypothetical protein
METSTQVMFLVTVVALSTVFAFYLDVGREAEFGRFVEWLKTETKADWQALTRADRLPAIRAVEILRRGALAEDPEFQIGYQGTRHGARYPTAIVVAGAGIALLGLCTALFEWNW